MNQREIDLATFGCYFERDGVRVDPREIYVDDSGAHVFPGTMVVPNDAQFEGALAKCQSRFVFEGSNRLWAPSQLAPLPEALATAYGMRAGLS